MPLASSVGNFQYQLAVVVRAEQLVEGSRERAFIEFLQEKMAGQVKPIAAPASAT
jgi:hypothetical protein